VPYDSSIAKIVLPLNDATCVVMKVKAGYGTVTALSYYDT